MKGTDKMMRFGLALLLLCVAVSVSAFEYDDTVQPDISDDRLAPDRFVLALGDNRLTSAQQGDAFGRDIDYFVIEVPAGLVIDAVFLERYEADPGNLAFLGLQEGTIFSVDPAAATAADLLGGIVFGAPQVGQDVLSEIGTLAGAQGFTGPLQPGSYAFWVQQTGPPNEGTLNFRGRSTLPPRPVPALAPWSIATLALLVLLVGLYSRRV